MATNNKFTPSSKSSKIITEGLTFDDVLLVPAYSQLLPKDVTISGRIMDVRAEQS